MAVGFDSISCLPNDITNDVFCNLGYRDLVRCCEVCKLWQKLARADDLWKNAVPVILDFSKSTSKLCDVPVASNFYQKDFKLAVGSHAVCSENQLIRRFKKFIKEAPLNQRCKFIGVFPFDSNPCIRIELLYGHGDRSDDVRPDRFQFLILLGALQKSEGDHATINHLGFKLNCPLPYKWSPLNLMLGGHPGAIQDYEVHLPDPEAQRIDDQISQLMRSRMADLADWYKVLNVCSWGASAYTSILLASAILYYSL